MAVPQLVGTALHGLRPAAQTCWLPRRKARSYTAGVPPPQLGGSPGLVSPPQLAPPDGVVGPFLTGQERGGGAGRLSAAAAAQVHLRPRQPGGHQGGQSDRGADQQVRGCALAPSSSAPRSSAPSSPSPSSSVASAVVRYNAKPFLCIKTGVYYPTPHYFGVEVDVHRWGKLALNGWNMVKGHVQHMQIRCGMVIEAQAGRLGRRASGRPSPSLRLIRLPPRARAAPPYGLAPQCTVRAQLAPKMESLPGCHCQEDEEMPEQMLMATYLSRMNAASCPLVPEHALAAAPYADSMEC